MIPRAEGAGTQVDGSAYFHGVGSKPAGGCFVSAWIHADDVVPGVLSISV